MELWWLRIYLVVFIEHEPEYKIFRNKAVLFIGTIGKVPLKWECKDDLGFLEVHNSGEHSLATLNFELVVSQHLLPCVDGMSVSLSSLLCEMEGWMELQRQALPTCRGRHRPLPHRSLSLWGCCRVPSSLVFAVSVPHNSEGFLQPEVNHREKFWTLDREMSYLYDSFLFLPEQRWFLWP